MEFKFTVVITTHGHLVTLNRIVSALIRPVNAFSAARISVNIFRNATLPAFSNSGKVTSGLRNVLHTD